MEKIRTICKAEGITTVKEFRSYVEYWFLSQFSDILHDDDTEPETKRLYRSHTYAWWKKWYKGITDADIEQCLATEEEKQDANAAYAQRTEELRAKEAAKPDYVKQAEDEAEVLLRDAGYEYDSDMSWEENLERAGATPATVEAVRSAGHGGARENSGRKVKDRSGKAVTVSFCCSPAQRAQLDAATKSSGLSRSDYITMRLFGGEDSDSAGN